MESRAVEHLPLNHRRPAHPFFRAGIGIATVAVACAIGAVFAEGAARVIAPQWREYASARFMTWEIVPGYGTVAVGRPNFDGFFAQNDGDFRIRVRLNCAGLRNEDPPEAAAGWIWTIGDSFTFGWGVEIGESFGAELGRILGEPVYNVATPGGDVRSYQGLAARMPKKTMPRLVVVGLTVENDVIAYGPKESAGAGAEKPEENERLSWKEWGIGHSALYNLAAIAIKKSKFLHDLFVKAGAIAPAHGLREPPEVRRRQAIVESTAEELTDLRALFPPRIPVVVLIIPARFELLAEGAGWADLRRAVIAALAARGIPTVDPAAALAEAGFAATHFAHDGHWSRRGHEIAGRALAAWVNGNVPSAAAPR